MDDYSRQDPLSQFTKQDIAVGISVTAQVGARNIVLQTCLERDAPVGDFHGLMEKLEAVVERLELKREIEGKKASLEQAQKNAEASIRQAGLLEERSRRDWIKRGKKGDWALSVKEQADKDTHLTNVEASRVSRELLKQQIEELEAKIAKDA